MTQDFDIEKAWGHYKKLADKLSQEHEGVARLLKDLDQRIIETPASMTTDGFGCHPGGMVLLSLRVVEKMVAFSNALHLTAKISPSSILMVGLFHNLGAIGNLTEKHLIENDSSWHREKGILYTFNDRLTKSQISDRSLFILQHYGIQLSYDEWISISISGGSHNESNRFYVGHEPPLALLLQHSRTWVLGRNT